jgi:YHS domain-containing protein
MTRFAVLGIIIILFVMLVRALFPSKENKAASEPGEMVQDPNCQAYVPKLQAIEKEVAGETQFFCSEKCAEEFCGKNDDSS